MQKEDILRLSVEISNMIRDYTKILLFLSSYAPLFLILAVENYVHTYFVIFTAFLILIPTLILVYIIKKSYNMSGEYHELKEVEDKSNQFLEYIIAYIIPFLGLNLISIPQLVSLVILFLIIAFLYIRSDLIYESNTQFLRL